MNKTTPEERFAKCISLIGKGYIYFEDEAKGLVRNGLQFVEVDEALQAGASRLYDDYLGVIREGQADYEPVARRLAERFKFSTRALENALRTGIEVSQRPTLTRITEE
ncbi:MAG: hypothetical protein WC852_06925 [Candidatus Nanoarchaeia archaeon]|jgi:hypothetical protein